MVFERRSPLLSYVNERHPAGEPHPIAYGDRHIPTRLNDHLPHMLTPGDSPAGAPPSPMTAYTHLLRERVFGDHRIDGRALHYSIHRPAPEPSVVTTPPYLRKGTTRKICTTPFKVLDAPALQDDFYLNLVDWSSNNMLGVGLGNCVYLWSASTSKVTKLCELPGEDGLITSLCWAPRGTMLAVGTKSGEVHLYDTVKQVKIRTLLGHSLRVGTLSWGGHNLASGSRDRTILIRDHRASDVYTSRLTAHKQEVCGLRWSFDDKQLASGGNDNKLLIWSVSSTTPVARFAEHSAAVKALAWSPHQHGLLASGGGTADRCIRFWNTTTQTALSSIDTGSQVCNLTWSKNVNEVVSTHGYSLNQIIVWSYPTMRKLATLTGHTYRVLYLAISPDGQTIVTGAGDETLRFWNIFPQLDRDAQRRPAASRLGANRVAFSNSFTIR